MPFGWYNFEINSNKTQKGKLDMTFRDKESECRLKESDGHLAQFLKWVLKCTFNQYCKYCTGKI